MPTISVVVPVYKVEQYLDRCVQSILNQTYQDFELILVDDGSPDNCPALCDEYANKYDYVRVIHQENGGLSAARNTGIEWALKNSDSEWITFIDSDDWVHPQYLELLLKANMRYNSLISLSKLDFIDHYENPKRLPDSIDYQLLRPEDIYYDDSYDATAACARLYRINLFEEVRFPVGKWHEDTFTTYKLYFSINKVAVVNEELYYYFQNPESIVHVSWNPRKMDLFEATENQLVFFKEKKNDEMYRMVLNRYIKNIIWNMKLTKNDPKLKKYYFQLRKKLRLVLARHKKYLGLTYKKDINIYKYAYPLSAKIYRKFRLG